MEKYLTAYLHGCEPRGQAKGPLFRSMARGTTRLSDTPCPSLTPSRWYGLRRCNSHQDSDRQLVVLGNPDHRLIEDGGTLELAATMVNHASTHTTQLYDRRPDDRIAGWCGC